MKVTKALIEKAAKYGKPSYSITRRFIKGWTLGGKYIPNPMFTVDNVLQARLLVFETINILLKKGFEIAKEKTEVKGNSAMLTLRRGSEEKSMLLTSDEYQEIIKATTKSVFWHLMTPNDT